MNVDVFDTFPEIETRRLRLRDLVPEDAAGVFAIFGDDAVTCYYDIQTMKAQDQAARLIERMGDRYRSGQGIRWAIERLGDCGVVGTIGVNSIDDHASRASIGYDVAREYWGNGYATEAVTAVVDLCHRVVGVRRVEATVMLGNHASARVLAKAGFGEEGVLRSYGHWKGQFHDLRMFSSIRT